MLYMHFMDLGSRTTFIVQQLRLRYQKNQGTVYISLSSLSSIIGVQAIIAPVSQGQAFCNRFVPSNFL